MENILGRVFLVIIDESFKIFALSSLGSSLRHSVRLSDDGKRELAVQFRADRDHVSMARNELLEEPGYSIVGARVAAGAYQNDRRADGAR